MSPKIPLAAILSLFPLVACMGEGVSRDPGGGGFVGPLSDDVCDVEWTTGACPERSVSEVESGLIMSEGVVLAASGDGDVLLAWNDYAFLDEAKLSFVFFGNEAIRQHEVSRPFSVVGKYMAAVADGDGRFHLVYSETGVRSAIEHVTLFPNSTELPAPNTVPGAPGPISLGVTRRGSLILPAFQPLNLSLGVAEKPQDGDWVLEGDLFSASFDLDTPSVGRSAVAVDSSGTAHVGYLRAVDIARGQPHYSQRVGSEWTAPRTIVDPTADNLSGYGLDLVVLRDGSTAMAFYVVRQDNTASLHLASWRGNDAPKVELLVDNIPLSPSAPTAGLSLALAADSADKLHLVATVPTAETNTVAYWRRGSESPVWIREHVATEPTPGEVVVDLAVDRENRPHMGIYLSSLQTILYATREAR